MAKVVVSKWGYSRSYRCAACRLLTIRWNGCCEECGCRKKVTNERIIRWVTTWEWSGWRWFGFWYVADVRVETKA